MKNPFPGLAKSAGELATTALASASAAAETSGNLIKSGAGSTGRAMSAMGDSAGRTLKAVALLAGDLNGDGKVDFEDAKIATAKAKGVAFSVAEEVGKVGKEALRSDIVKEAAAGAAVGAVLASAVPFVGTATGAVAGAALGVYKSIKK